MELRLNQTRTTVGIDMDWIINLWNAASPDARLGSIITILAVIVMPLGVYLYNRPTKNNHPPPHSSGGVYLNGASSYPVIINTGAVVAKTGVVIITGHYVGDDRVAEYREVDGVREIKVVMTVGAWVRGQVAINDDGSVLVATDQDWANVETLNYGVRA